MPHQMDVTVLNFTGTQYLYHVTRLVPTEIIVIVLVKELGKSVLFWIIRKVPTLVQYGNVKSETWIESISVIINTVM